MPAFSREEYLSRLTETKRRMEAAGLDLLIVFDPSNIYYLSGYDGDSGYVPQCLLILPEEEEPRLILREMDVAGDSAFIGLNRIHGYSEDYIAHRSLHPFDYFADLFRRWQIDKRRTGVELRFLDPLSWQRLQNVLPDASLEDAHNLVTWQRLVKSPAELVYMDQAGKMADAAMQVAVNESVLGVRECDVAAEVTAAQIRGLPDYGGSRPKTAHMPTGSPRVASPHLSWSDEKLVPGAVTNVELGGFRLRYVCGISRTIVQGEPEARLVRLHEATREAVDTVFDQVAAGWTCEELEALFRRTTRRHGFEKKSRVGYAIGIDWTEQTASLRPGDTTILEPDMTFHLMAGMWYDDWGYVMSETFRVTDKGLASFHDFPRELVVK